MKNKRSDVPGTSTRGEDPKAPPASPPGQPIGVSEVEWISEDLPPTNLRPESGGHVLAAPSIVPIYWGNEYGGANDLGAKLDAFLNTICASSYFDLLSEYGVVGRPQVLPSARLFDDGTPASPMVNTGKWWYRHDDFADQLRKQLDAGEVTPKPVKDEQSLIYLLFLPKRIKINIGFDASAFHSWHWYAPSSWPWNTPNLFYAAIPFNDDEGFMTGSVTHELMEAFTDRDGSGWTNDGNVTGEIADFCQSGILEVSGYRVSSFWSKRLGRCIQQTDLPLNDPPTFTVKLSRPFAYGAPITYTVDTWDGVRGMPIVGSGQIFHYPHHGRLKPQPCGIRFTVPGSSAPVTVPISGFDDAPFLLFEPRDDLIWKQVRRSIV